MGEGRATEVDFGADKVRCSKGEGARERKEGARRGPGGGPEEEGRGRERGREGRGQTDTEPKGLTQRHRETGTTGDTARKEREDWARVLSAPAAERLAQKPSCKHDCSHGAAPCPVSRREGPAPSAWGPRLWRGHPSLQPPGHLGAQGRARSAPRSPEPSQERHGSGSRGLPGCPPSDPGYFGS